jgi:hypothetical protein
MKLSKISEKLSLSKSDKVVKKEMMCLKDLRIWCESELRR